MNAWWRISVRINWALGGQPKEPLCSRVYRQPPSLWRSLFMVVMDRAFSETAHCENIHLRWRSMDANLPREAREPEPIEGTADDVLSVEGLVTK